jgi:hypothetical protein
MKKSYETIRNWCAVWGPVFAKKIEEEFKIKKNH